MQVAVDEAGQHVLAGSVDDTVGGGKQTLRAECHDLVSADGDGCAEDLRRPDNLAAYHQGVHTRARHGRHISPSPDPARGVAGGRL